MFMVMTPGIPSLSLPNKVDRLQLNQW